MKKLAMLFLFIFMVGIVSATNYYVVIDDQAPVSDIALVTDLKTLLGRVGIS